MKPYSLRTSSATSGTSLRAAKPIQASMKCTWTSVSSWAENDACARSRSIFARSVPRFDRSSAYRGTGFTQVSQSAEKPCRRTCARSAGVSVSIGLRPISSSTSTAVPEAYASSCSRSEGAQFTTALARSGRSSAAAMSL